MLRSLSTKSLRIANRLSTKCVMLPALLRISPPVPLLTSSCALPISIQKRFINIRTELKEVHCCTGCGVQLQYMKESEYGFIPYETLVSYLEKQEKPICQRCHRVFDLLQYLYYSYVITERWIKMKSLLPFLKK